MKKVFGWFFIVLGVLNIIRGFLMISHKVVGNAGGILFFGIGYIGLGVWLISSSQKKSDDNLPSKQ